MLDGKKIIITRKADSNDRISQPLYKLGADVVNFELIKIAPLAVNATKLHETIQGDFQWIIFTSSNGAISFFTQLQKLFPKALLTNKFAVFGPRTAETLQNYGYQANLTCSGESAASLAIELRQQLSKTDKVLLALGNLAATTLEIALTGLCRIERINIYETTPVQTAYPEVLEAIIANNYDLLIITSPSSYKSLKLNTGKSLHLDATKIACLGPTTEKTLNADGLVPAIVAKPTDNPGLTELIVQQLSDKNKISTN